MGKEQKKTARVAVVGLGPVGMILAARFASAGFETAICETNRTRCEKIESDGIILENIIPVHATFKKVYRSIPELAEFNPQYIFFALKSNHTPEALKAAEILNTPDAVFISAQNGIDVEQMFVQAVGETKTMRMVINFAGAAVSANTTRVTFFNAPNYIGPLDSEQSTKAHALSEFLSQAGLDTEAVDTFGIIKKSWEKTILNASLSPLCGVSRLTMAEAMNDRDTLELVEQIIQEAIQVAEAEKIKFPDEFVRHCLTYLRKGGDHFPSLALDLIHNRPTEIDYFNGKIVEYGRKHYIRTSLNLAFTNMVKAMTNKNILSRMPGTTTDVSRKVLDKGLVQKNLNAAIIKNTDCFLGIDLGSAYSKFTVIDNKGNVLFRYLVPSQGNERHTFKNVLQTVKNHFTIRYSCATGYGRKHFDETDIIKTEINCAAAAVSFIKHGEKNIIDIGGEDIKIIRCDAQDSVQNFYMNDKCAAGTGSFLEEIANRAMLDTHEMSGLASLSKYDQELNSFCTVFAKTEIMNWIFDGMRPEDIARGIYISIANRVAKMRLDPGIPTYMIGGVVAVHPYLKDLLNAKFDKNIEIIDSPQYAVSMGAALIAKDYWNRKEDKNNQVSKEIPLKINA